MMTTLRIAASAAAALVSLSVSAGAQTAAARATPRATPRAAPAAERAAVATHRVRMIGDEKGFRFEPAQLTVAPGDRINFVMVSGGPHNVQFEADKIGDAGERALRAVMRDTIADLTSQMYMNEGETYTLTMTNVPAGSYPYVCTPHAAMGMRGTITVRGGAGGAKPAAARRPARKGS